MLWSLVCSHRLTQRTSFHYLQSRTWLTLIYNIFPMKRWCLSARLRSVTIWKVVISAFDYRSLLQRIQFTCTAWVDSLNPHDGRVNTEGVCQKQQSLSLTDLLSTGDHLLDISFIISLQPNLCTSLTTQNITDNCIIFQAQTRLHCISLYFQLKYIDYWSQAKDVLYFLA